MTLSDGPRIEWCGDVCERAKWRQDPMFPHLGQYNCPRYFGVTYRVATIDGKPTCKLLRRRADQ